MTWKGRRAYRSEIYVVVPPISENSYTINVLPDTAYPLSAITVSASSTPIVTAESVFRLSESIGGEPQGEGWVIRDETGSVVTSIGGGLYTIPIAYASRGKQRRGQLNLTSTSLATFTNARAIRAATPRITDDGDIFKDGILPFVNAYPPVANAGPDKVAFLTSPAVNALIEFGNVPSYKTNPVASSSLSYQWVNMGTGAVLSTAANFSTTFGAGVHEVRLQVTDSLGVSDIAYVKVVVIPASFVAPYLYPAQITSHTIRRDGQSLEIDLTILPETQQTAYNVLRKGREVLVIKREFYDESPTSYEPFASSTSLLGTFWVEDESTSGEADQGRYKTKTSLSLVDIGGRLKALAGYPLVVERQPPYDNWDKFDGLNADRYMHFLLRWHSNALSRAPFVWSGTGDIYKMTVIGSDQGSLYDQLARMASAIGHAFTVDRYGIMRIVGDPIVLPTPSQAAEFSLPVQRTSATVATLTHADIVSWRVSDSYAEPSSWTWGESLIAGDDLADSIYKIQTVFSVAPGRAPGQGIGEEQYSQNLATSQEELNVRLGNHHAARVANESGLHTIELRSGNIDIDPGAMEWVQASWGGAGVDRGAFAYNSPLKRYLPVSLSVQYEQNGSVKTTLEAEEEIIGFAAETYFMPDEAIIDNPPPTVIIVPPTPPPITPPTIRTPTIPPPVTGVTPPLPAPKLGKGVAVFTSDGRMHITKKIETPASIGGPQYKTFNLTLNPDYPGGDLCGFAADPFSPNYVSGSGQVNGWIVTENGIARITDVFGVAPALNLQYSFSSSTKMRTVRAAGTLKGWVSVVSYKSGEGTTTVYTTDSGFNWNDKVISQIDHDATLPMKERIEPGLALSAHRKNVAVTSISKVVPTGIFALGLAPANAAWSDTFDPITNSFSWNIVNTGLTGANGIWATSDPFNKSRYYALTSDGVFRNNNVFTGGTWTKIASNTDLFGSSSNIGHEIIMSKHRQGWIAVASGRAVSISTDYGATWTVYNIGGGPLGTNISNANNCSIVVSPHNTLTDGVLYASYSITSAQNFYKSNDWGVTWSLVGQIAGSFGNNTAHLAIPEMRLPGDPNINDANQWLYAQWGALNQGAIWRSTSSGATWVIQIFINAAGRDNKPYYRSWGRGSLSFPSDGRLYAGVMGGNNGLRAVRYSTNAGAAPASLIEVQSSISVASYGSMNMARLANLDNAWVAWGNGPISEAAYSIDGGVTRNNINYAFGQNKAYAYIDWFSSPFASSLSSSNSSVLQTTNAGAAWTVRDPQPELGYYPSGVFAFPYTSTKIDTYYHTVSAKISNAAQLIDTQLGRTIGDFTTDESPSFSGNTYGTLQGMNDYGITSASVAFAPDDNNTLLACLVALNSLKTSAISYAVFWTQSALGKTVRWRLLSPTNNPDLAWRSVYIVNQRIAYFGGKTRKLGLWSGGLIIEDKTGNIPGTGITVGVCGER